MEAADHRDRNVLAQRAIGVLLALLSFEIVLRFLAYGVPTLDPKRGWVYRSMTVRHRLWEGHGVSHWDSAANRASPFRPSVPSKRILTVGDSMTEALQVSDSEVFTAQLELALQQARWPVAVLNAGRSNLSIADYIATASSDRDEFEPAWTIVQLRLDDLTTDCRVPNRTHFIDEGTGLRVEVVPPRFGRISSLLLRLRRRSALLDVAISRASLFNAAARLPPMFRGGDDAPRAAAARAIPDYPIEEELAMLTAAWAGRLTIALIPDPTRAQGDVERRVLAYGRERGVSVVNMRDAFPRFDGAQSSPFGFRNSEYGKGHLNAPGHEALASLLANELMSLRARGLF